MSERNGNCTTCDALLYPMAVSVRVAQGELEAATEFCRRLAKEAADYGSHTWLAMSRQVHGELEAARGDNDEAVQAHEEAISNFWDAGFLYEAARCLEAVADMHSRLDESGEDENAAQARPSDPSDLSDHASSGKSISSAMEDAMTLNVEDLRGAIREEYEAVAADPQRGFHFHTGRPLALMLGYREEWLVRVPETAIESFAGTGNPFSLGRIRPGEQVVDVGSGAGIDCLIAAHMVAPDGRVVGVDMTPAMLEKARQAAAETDLDNVEFREGYGEALPVPDDWADVVISNGVLNLMPDKEAALREMARALKPDGRLQIGDILVAKAVPESAKARIDLWTG